MKTTNPKKWEEIFNLAKLVDIILSCDDLFINSDVKLTGACLVMAEGHYEEGEYVTFDDLEDLDDSVKEEVAHIQVTCDDESNGDHFRISRDSTESEYDHALAVLQKFHDHDFDA